MRQRTIDMPRSPKVCAGQDLENNLGDAKPSAIGTKQFTATHYFLRDALLRITITRQGDRGLDDVGAKPLLTCRANQAHKNIIAKIIRPAPINRQRALLFSSREGQMSGAICRTAMITFCLI
jgi:hypothetical protein